MLVQAVKSLNVKTREKPPSVVTLVVGGYDARKERFKGRISLEQFTWQNVNCCFVEMGREEVRIITHLMQVAEFI